MAFFKFRKAANEPARTPPAPQSIDALRQRAKYRLAGASVLVLLGVIGFPLLFDKQPRPVALGTPIDIPDRNKVLPLALPVLPAPAAPVASSPAQVSATLAPVAPAAVPAEVAAVPNATAVTAVAKPSSEKKVSVAPVESGKTDINSVAAAPTKPTQAVASAALKTSDAAKAQSLLEDKPPGVGEGGRFVVQVGAFADADRAREVRTKLEKAGLKTYTHVAETKDGQRIRVRVGPFATKPEAQKVAEKIKQLHLPTAVLTL